MQICTAERMPLLACHKAVWMLFVALLSSGISKQPSAHGQNATVQKAAGEATQERLKDKPSEPVEVTKLRKLVTAAKFDEIIDQSTLEIAKTTPTDERLLFLRGYAAYKTSRFDLARQDLKSLGNFALTPAYPTAAKMLSEVNALLELRPAKEHIVRVKDRVVFRVYSSQDDELTRNALEALPQGYEAASTFLHKEVEDIPVFIFNGNEYEQFFKFYTLLGSGQEPHMFWRFLSRRGSITLSQRDGAGKESVPSVTALTQTIAHEMTHVLMQRMVTGVKGFPNWFNEGASQLVAGSLSPATYTRNDSSIKRLIKQGAILPIDKITAHAEFHENVDQLREGSGKGDPYAQGLSMTRYLGFVAKGMKLSDFLASMQQKKNFEAALKDHTGMTMAEFYASWLKFVGASPTQ
jgi:hypothetical protein